MPYQVFEVETSLTKQRVTEILQSSLTQLNWLGQPKDSAPFMGRVSADGFRIVRAIGGRDTFNPVMYGKILLSDNGACIKVIMTFHPLVWLLMLALTAFSGSILFAYFQNPVNIDSTTLPCPFLVVAFPWIIGVLIFFYDSVKSKALFLHVLGLSEADVRK